MNSIFKNLALLFVCGLCLSACKESDADHKAYSWHYKMIVTVETPEGVVTGSTVREMSNAVPRLDLPDVGNPAEVKGEAVVVDLGKRGILFTLISSDSDMEFYNAFPVSGPSTLKGIKYYASLPLGTKGTINPERNPGYPKLVTFTDLNDPKSVTLVQVWERDKKGYFHLKEDRMAELFGEGVKLKDITFEITDEPVMWGIVDGYLPDALQELKENWKKLPYSEKERIYELITFKQGEPK